MEIQSTVYTLVRYLFIYMCSKRKAKIPMGHLCLAQECYKRLQDLSCLSSQHYLKAHAGDALVNLVGSLCNSS